jgi:hypothetical protein
MEMGGSSGILVHFYLVLGSRKLELYLHSPIYLPGAVLN